MTFKKGETPEGAIPFVPGESGNPNGRPRKLLSSINKELTERGFERVSASQVMESFELLFNLTEEEIKERAIDKESPMLLRIAGKAMLSSKGMEMVEKMLDRAHGKAQQKMQVDITELPEIHINYKKLNEG